MRGVSDEDIERVVEEILAPTTLERILPPNRAGYHQGPTRHIVKQALVRLCHHLAHGGQP